MEQLNQRYSFDSGRQRVMTVCLSEVVDGLLLMTMAVLKTKPSAPDCGWAKVYNLADIKKVVNFDKNVRGGDEAPFYLPLRFHSESKLLLLSLPCLCAWQILTRSACLFPLDGDVVAAAACRDFRVWLWGARSGVVLGSFMPPSLGGRAQAIGMHSVAVINVWGVTSPGTSNLNS